MLSRNVKNIIDHLKDIIIGVVLLSKIHYQRDQMVQVGIRPDFNIVVVVSHRIIISVNENIARAGHSVYCHYVDTACPFARHFECLWLIKQCLHLFIVLDKQIGNLICRQLHFLWVRITH